MIAEPAVHVKDGGVTVIVEICNDGAGCAPLLPAGQFTQARLAGVEEDVMLPAGVAEKRTYRESREYWAA